MNMPAERPSALSHLIFFSFLFLQVFTTTSALLHFGNLNTPNIIPRIQPPGPHWWVFRSETDRVCPG